MANIAHDRVAIITGASRGIGAAVAGRLAADGIGKSKETVDRLAVLAGPDGSWVNGQVLRANGGLV